MDFKFYFLLPLPSPSTPSFYIHPHCTAHGKVYYPKTYDAWSPLECQAPTLLHFPRSVSQVCLFVLKVIASVSVWYKHYAEFVHFLDITTL